MHGREVCPRCAGLLRPGVVALDRGTAAAHGGTARDLTHAPVGAVLVLPDGSAYRVTDEGALDPVNPFGRRSIASEPSATRRSGRR